MKKLFLLPLVAMFALVGCDKGGASKKWQRVTAAPVAGDDYRLVLDRGSEGENSGLWYITGQNGVEAGLPSGSDKEYYFATDADASKAAKVSIISGNGGGFFVKIGERYLFIGKVGSYTNSLFKDNKDEATEVSFDATLGVVGVSIDEHFWGLGTRNDKTFTTAGAVDLTKFPDNYKVYLEQYK